MREPEEAARFLRRAGLILLFPGRYALPTSLWEAVTGTREVVVFTQRPDGRRELGPDLVTVWRLKEELTRRRLACVGRHLRSRVALVAPGLLPALYALTGRSGRPGDHRQPGCCSGLELELADALMAAGPRTAAELARLLGRPPPRMIRAALHRLQATLVVTQAGEAEQAGGWPAVRFELTTRRFAARLRALPDPGRAREELAGALLRSAGELSVGDLRSALGFSLADAVSALEWLAASGRAERQEGGRSRSGERPPPSGDWARGGREPAMPAEPRAGRRPWAWVRAKGSGPVRAKTVE